MERAEVAVIGAGVAGLACARRLTEAGVSVLIYDKGRGPGGRLSGRRTPIGRFDHGAQFMTIRDEGFAAACTAWRAAGLIAEWDGDHRRHGAPLGHDPWYVGTPKMSAFIEHEATALGATFGLRLATPTREAHEKGRWHLRTETGESAWAADWVVFAVPAEQADALLPPSSPLAADARGARSAPTWTLMAAWDDAPAPFDSEQPQDGPLAFVSRQASRPGAAPGHRWVAHATSEWTRAHLEADAATVADALSDALAALIGTGERPVHAGAHRWRYAQVEETAEAPFGLDEANGLGTCGDWHVAPRIESAWVSGDGLGSALADRL